jgi:hypothetical protein
MASLQIISAWSYSSAFSLQAVDENHPASLQTILTSAKQQSMASKPDALSWLKEGCG